MSYNNNYPDAASDICVEEPLSIQSISYELHFLSAISTIKENPIIKNDESSSFKIESNDSDEIPETKEFSVKKKFFKISFDYAIKDEMYQNESFMRFISEIEKELFVFSELYKILFVVNIYFQQDWEVKDLKNIILKIKFLGISFKKEMILWEKLSQFIRKILKISEFNITSKEIMADFIDFNKRFYIKVDLS